MTLQVIVSPQIWTARSFSFFWIQRIYVGSKYSELMPFERRAVIAHECAHLAGHHTEWRLLALLLPPLWPWLSAICHWQEYLADRHAWECGHRDGLLHILKKDTPGSFTHPKNMDRRNKLLHTS